MNTSQVKTDYKGYYIYYSDRSAAITKDGEFVKAFITEYLGEVDEVPAIQRAKLHIDKFQNVNASKGVKK